MANDIYLKIDGIEGESVKKGAEKTIQLLSWKCGVTNKHSAEHGGGLGSGKAEPHHLEFTHHYDKASPVLQRHCAAGKHLPTVKLVVSKSGDGQKEYLTITLKNAFVTHISHDCQTDATLSTVHLAYEDIEHEYKQQGDDGSLKGSVKAGWNTKTHELR